MPTPRPPAAAERLAALHAYLSLDPLSGEAFDRILALTAQVLDAPCAVVNLVGEDWQFTVASHGAPLTGLVLPREEVPCSLTVLGQGVVVIEDLAADPRFAHHPEVGPDSPVGVRMYAGAPLVTAGGQAVGTLCVFDTRVRGLEGRERQVLRTLAAVVMDELDLRLRTRELTQARDHARTLRDLAELMHEPQGPEETAQRALALLHARMRLDWSGLLRLTPGGPEVLRDHAGPRGEAYRAVMREPVTLEGTPLWAALRRREHVFVDDYAAEPETLAHLLAAGLRSAAWLFLRDGQGGAPYVLALARLGEPSGWTPDERGLLEAAVRSVGVALERAEHVRDLERAALTDALTGLGNRRALDEALDEAARLHAQAGAGYVLAVVDLDGMKRVNDERGHASGDDLLRAFALALRAPDVTAYRLGGDEYALLHVAPRGGAAAREELVALVEAAARHVRALGYPADASVGVAGVPDDARDATTALRTADLRMYARKRERLRLRGGE
ncbi:sensor domain-containing diguanylate cyclase [Deinococcus planocerae]|uniref:sensor domain-containing diguanylate cyclase n=1 Tax=Deinococcus planocerae TaxID=1737569 RepID=UPI000C7F5913|nr:diguanylate cyclase [Deinococcus planocerae]